MAIALNMFQPCLGMFFCRLREAAFIGDETPMGAGTNARIFAIAPLDEIVPAFSARARMI
jgi:hypothetical protein